MLLASGAGIKQAQRSFTHVTLLKSDEAIYDFIRARQGLA